MTCETPYIVGTQLELRVNFTDQDGDPADPNTVTAVIRLPAQTEEVLTPDITHPGIGDYRVLFTPTMNGLYEYRFDGDGAVTAAGEKYFTAQTVFPEES